MKDIPWKSLAVYFYSVPTLLLPRPNVNYVVIKRLPYSISVFNFDHEASSLSSGPNTGRTKRIIAGKFSHTGPPSNNMIYQIRLAW